MSARKGPERCSQGAPGKCPESVRKVKKGAGRVQNRLGRKAFFLLGGRLFFCWEEGSLLLRGHPQDMVSWCVAQAREVALYEEKKQGDDEVEEKVLEGCMNCLQIHCFILS